MTDSSTGGYLTPGEGPDGPVVDDFALDSIFQKLIAGLTGLPGNLVRPRWQPVMPRIPEPGVDWCAIGVMNIEPDNDPVFIHQPRYEANVGTVDGDDVFAQGSQVTMTDTDGQDVMARQKIVTLLASFYGPNSMSNAEIAADGIYVCQNEGVIGAANMVLIDVSPATPSPDLVNQQWVRRFDISIRVRRQTKRTYSILNLLELQASLNTEGNAQDLPAS